MHMYVSLYGQKIWGYISYIRFCFTAGILLLPGVKVPGRLYPELLGRLLRAMVKIAGTCTELRRATGLITRNL